MSSSVASEVDLFRSSRLYAFPGVLDEDPFPYTDPQGIAPSSLLLRTSAAPSPPEITGADI